jgi:hypothetical protein
MKILGGILLAIGILIAGASGLCSLMMLSSGSGMDDIGGMLPLVLIFGGIPLAVGVAFGFAGWFLIRSEAPDDNNPRP